MHAKLDAVQKSIAQGIPQIGEKIAPTGKGGNSSSVLNNLLRIERALLLDVEFSDLPQEIVPDK